MQERNEATQQLRVERPYLGLLDKKSLRIPGPPVRAFFQGSSELGGSMLFVGSQAATAGNPLDRMFPINGLPGHVLRRGE
jgi:hypothetical protein